MTFSKGSLVWSLEQPEMGLGRVQSQQGPYVVASWMGGLYAEHEAVLVEFQPESAAAEIMAHHTVHNNMEGAAAVS